MADAAGPVGKVDRSARGPAALGGLGGEQVGGLGGQGGVVEAGRPPSAVTTWSWMPAGADRRVGR